MPDTDAQERSLTGHEARWERHNSARQTRIVESAVALLDESAPGTEIPVQSIAKRAGLAKSVVYRQFEDARILTAGSARICSKTSIPPSRRSSTSTAVPSSISPPEPFGQFWIG